MSLVHMSDDDPRARSTDYRAARIGGALVLFLAVAFIVTADAFSAAYEASPITVGILLTTAAALLGVELASLIRGGK